jgi:hypothetical protein
MLSSQTTIRVSALRTTIAPTVPQIIACRCRCRGTLRAASAITMALSPASTRSMTMIAANAERNSMLSSSKRQAPQIFMVSRIPPGAAAAARNGLASVRH